MASQISALREVFVTVLTRERPLPRVLAEVVPQVARLLEDTPAVRVHALEEQLLALRRGILDLYRLVPVRGNSLELLPNLNI